MNIGIIIGSHRKASQSAKVGRFLSTLLETEFGAHTWTRDLGATPLPYGMKTSGTTGRNGSN